MACVYSLGVKFELGQNNHCGWEFRTSALASAIITELSLAVYGSSAATSLGIGRPTTRGIGALGQNLIADDPADGASQSQIAVDWTGNSPVAPSNFLRRFSTNTTMGPAVFITAPKGIVIPLAASLGIFSLAGTTQSMSLEASCSARE